MRRRIVRVPAVGLCAAVLGLVLGACTSSGGGSTTPTAAGSTTVGGSSAPASGSPSGSSSGGARFADPAQAARILSDARHAVVVANSYDYRSFQAALDAGDQICTGDYCAAYRKSLTGIRATVASAHAAQTASVKAIGLGPVSGTSATVLVFGELDVTNSSTPKSRTDSFSATLSLDLVGSSWKLAGLSAGAYVPGNPLGPADLVAATQAARIAGADIFTYRRSTFDADADRASAATTGAIHDQVTSARSATRSALTKGKYDLEGTVTAAAVVSASGDTASIMVAVQAFKVVDGAKQTPANENLTVTMTRSSGRWLMSDVTLVGTS